MTTWGFSRIVGAHRNQLNQCCSELLGMAEGLIADGTLNNAEITFLGSWLEKHDLIACEWPGDVLADRVKAVLADGIITEEERAHLVTTLQQIVGGRIEAMADVHKVNELAFDDQAAVTIPQSLFCLTGDFVFAPRSECEKAITERGGRTTKSVTKKLNYLVVGGLGSDEWKHGSFGTKIAKAIDYKRDGCGIAIVREDRWTACLAR